MSCAPTVSTVAATGVVDEEELYERIDAVIQRGDGMLRRASRVAGAFLSGGLGPGAKVAQYLFNRPERAECSSQR